MGNSPWGCKESDRTEQLGIHAHHDCHYSHYVLRLWLPHVATETVRDFMQMGLLVKKEDQA